MKKIKCEVVSRFFGLTHCDRCRVAGKKASEKECLLSEVMAKKEEADIVLVNNNWAAFLKDFTGKVGMPKVTNQSKKLRFYFVKGDEKKNVRDELFNLGEEETKMIVWVYTHTDCRFFWDRLCYVIPREAIGLIVEEANVIIIYDDRLETISYWGSKKFQWYNGV
jgi:hypothetical protein